MAYRNEKDRELDKQFLIKAMELHPNLIVNDYYLMLLEHLRERNAPYTLTHTTVYNDIRDINKVSLSKSAKASIKEEQKQKALDDHDLMLQGLLEELSFRINNDRNIEEVTYEDLTAKEMDKFSVDELMVFNKLRNKIKKQTVKIKKIRKGSDIKDICEAIANVWKEKRKMIGIDEPRKTQTTTTHLVKNIDEMEEEELKALLKDLGDDKEKLLNMIGSIFNNKN